MRLGERVKNFVMAGVIAFAGVGLALAPVAASATDAEYEACLNAATTPAAKVKCGTDASGLSSSNTLDLQEMIRKIINTILYVVGVLAVVMVIWGGIQYTISAGDQKKVTNAKNTILYGLIGVVISVLAYSIVQFVLSKL